MIYETISIALDILIFLSVCFVAACFHELYKSIIKPSTAASPNFDRQHVKDAPELFKPRNLVFSRLALQGIEEAAFTINVALNTIDAIGLTPSKDNDFMRAASIRFELPKQKNNFKRTSGVEIDMESICTA